MKLPASSQSRRIGKLAEIDYGSSGSSPWSTECLDDKQQYVICEILFDEIVLSASGAFPPLALILPSDRLTSGLSVPCCEWQKQDNAIVPADSTSVLHPQQGERSFLTDSLQVLCSGTVCRLGVVHFQPFSPLPPHASFLAHSAIFLP